MDLDYTDLDYTYLDVNCKKYLFILSPLFAVPILAFYSYIFLLGSFLKSNIFIFFIN
jgi:hypothetical protein